MYSNILLESFYEWMARLIRLRFNPSLNKLTRRNLSRWIIRNGAFTLILNSQTRFIIKGRVLEIAQMVSLYLWHRVFYWRWCGIPAESTDDDCRVWKGSTLFSFYYILTRGDALNGEENTQFFFKSDATTALHWTVHWHISDWNNRPNQWKEIKILLLSSLSHVPLNVSWQWSLIVFFLCVDWSRKLGNPVLAAPTVTTWSYMKGFPSPQHNGTPHKWIKELSPVLIWHVFAPEIGCKKR